MLANVICRFAKHQINRKKVWHDGLDYRASCTRCHQPMIRDAHGWREFDETLDAAGARMVPPSAS